MPQRTFFRIEAWTNRFLGTSRRGRSLFRLLETMDGGRWVPERWNTVEPIRKPFSRNVEDEIIKRWTEDRPPGSGEVWNDLLFRRKRPRALIVVHARRFATPKLNSIWVELETKPFLTTDGPHRLRAILQALVTWSDAVYGSVYYSKQSHKRIAQMTPLQRLQQAYWLNFFGQPYVDLFGHQRVLHSPCYSIEEVEGGGAFLQATPRFDSPEITDSHALLIALEEHLGPDTFAGRGYPKIPCRVPRFDLSETSPI